ncbi:MAG: ribosome biogenesis GTP-binding protein YihA/YsxC [Succinivibrio dextrinosolvens]|jgi:GTP-binding protein|uniref:Probable GTP-binding protein EngB n=1 Tax=Succinivibrio dextrinosolvens TaxID=83771 RepID=A0A662Z6G2_9GAMM|nr:ribosome biogenesis GTP-binding protein YihA/YsxC [Succinivibrio dextrinosolvens]MBQ3883937.1 YihA family ribosome biogenesis GTP-binding protein [Succinivibrio sp.]MDY6417000.1 ribosome biogenesis GTP-binding protein YihA/YsxC [Succinivibrio dextrinosolvens]MDY6420654.1 ribosome biogenesis GTP-binding protein YihA/YsxC [Succinivibrio dextrinosolvens]MDY6466029.1 ribosome biogenesis GTP-binding protein YihA/YsxC [Succinivibrio dextrinosolvens]SFJ79870.1 GTP-binding protein [Succinivibrio de
MTDTIKKAVLDFRKTKFVTSAPDISKLPEDLGAEIAIIGRSNSGKSSSINAICDQKNLAKTSRTPGRTRLINLFSVADKRYLVDLPGYGYAQVPENMKRQWQKSMTDYLQQRKCLCGLVVTMDIRTPLRDHDRMIIDWSIASNLPALILLTKADKFGVNKRKEMVGEVRTALSEFGGNFKIIAFSALKKIGIDETREVLRNWFELTHTDEE